MKRLLLPGVLALILHGLFFSMEAEWMKGPVAYRLHADPIALILSYKPSQRKVSKPQKGPVPIQKSSVSGPNEEKAHRGPVKEVKKSTRPQAARPPQRIKKSLPVPVAGSPKSKSVFRSIHPKPVEKGDRIHSKMRTAPLQSIHSEPPFAQPGSEAYEEVVDFSIAPVNEDKGTMGPPSREEAPPGPSLREIREALPLYRENPPPKYPTLARRRGYEGTVVLRVLVNAQGKVKTLQIVKSSGHRILDRAALAAVKKWGFEPGSRGKEKVEMWVKVPIKFQLK